MNESTSSGLVKVPHNWVIKMDVVSAQYEERWRPDGLQLMKGLGSGGLLGWQELTRVLPVCGEERAGRGRGGFLLGDSTVFSGRVISEQKSRFQRKWSFSQGMNILFCLQNCTQKSFPHLLALWGIGEMAFLTSREIGQVSFMKERTWESLCEAFYDDYFYIKLWLWKFPQAHPSSQTPPLTAKLIDSGRSQLTH